MGTGDGENHSMSRIGQPGKENSYCRRENSRSGQGPSLISRCVMCLGTLATVQQECNYGLQSLAIKLLQSE